MAEVAVRLLSLSHRFLGGDFDSICWGGGEQRDDQKKVDDRY
jgi:hypothetical protein